MCNRRFLHIIIQRDQVSLINSVRPEPDEGHIGQRADYAIASARGAHRERKNQSEQP